MVLAFPIVRGVDLFPTTLLVEAASAVSPDRGASLKTRFDQEQQLLAHASERFWFGWGGWGRNRVYDVQTGNDVTITDGHWIITMGSYGLIGFLAEFMLLTLPVFRVASALKFVESSRDKINLAGLTLILTANIVDLLPNSSISPWTWLLAGALLGRTESLYAAARQRSTSGISKPLEVNVGEFAGR